MHAPSDASIKKFRTVVLTPNRARRQFIGDLAHIYICITGQRPGRRVHDQESGPFRDFDTAALDPFNSAMGCEADMKVVLSQLKAKEQR